LDFYDIFVGIIIGFLWDSIGFLWNFHDMSMIFLEDYYGISVGIMGIL